MTSWHALSSPRKLLLTSFAVLAGAYGAICGYLWLGQNRLIYMSQRGLLKTPETHGLAYEEVHLQVPAGAGNVQRVHGWWLPTEGEQYVLLYLHGNGFNISANVEHAAKFQQLGFSALLIDYRGFGNSDGELPSEAQMYEDALAAWKYLVEERRIDPKKIFIYGHSLGGAVAVDLASRVEAAGLIVEGTFTSLLDMASRDRRYRFFPLDLLLHQRFDSVKKIRDLRHPVLIMHGLADAVVPHEMGERLYREAGSALKRLFLIPHGGHENSSVVAGNRYLREIRSFVQEAQQGELARHGRQVEHG